MRVLITAGGTAEKIDQVRSITNHSTGKLGSLIAEAFLAAHARVDYVTTAAALRPAAHENLQLHQISGTQELADKMADLLHSTPYDTVIHSMAVSDFTPAQSLSQEQFLAKLNQLVQTKETVTADDLDIFLSDEKQETKISSATEQLYLILKKTPKVIQQIKKIQPDTLLVGFKLLVDVSKEELLQVAQNSLQKNQADYVLANDLTSIGQGKHRGYLIDHTGAITGQAESKEAIAQLIVKTITDHL